MTPSSPRTGPRPPRGFTLVEVLVGALVLGIFISFVYGAVVSAFNVRTVVESSTSAMAEGSMAVEFIARDLEGAFFLVEEKDSLIGFKAEDEGGDRTRLDFVTTLDSRGQEEIENRMLRSDIAETGYRLRQSERGFALYRREQFGVDDRPLEGGDYHRVIDGVRQFTVVFPKEDPANDEGAEDVETETTWDAKDKGRLPWWAKITLVLEGHSTDPAAADEMVEYTFTRWVVLPGRYDTGPGKPDPDQNP